MREGETIMPMQEARVRDNPVTRELERLRAAIARHREKSGSWWRADLELYVAAGLEPPEVLE